MDIQSLPTDSTKKFFFILGVVLMAYSVFKANNIYHDFRLNKMSIDSVVMLKKQQLIADSSFRSYKAKWINTQNESIARAAKAAKVSIKKYISDSEKQGLKFGGMWDDVNYMDSATKFNRQAIKLGSYRDYRKSTFKEELAIILFSFLFGFILAATGFKNWKSEETIRDQILSRQLDLLNLEYDAKRAVLENRENSQ
jgi:hypothetical protein